MAQDMLPHVNSTHGIGHVNGTHGIVNSTHEPPKVLYEAAINIAHIIDVGTFKDLLFEVASDQFSKKHIQVFGHEKKKDKWTKLQDGLTDYLQALVQLNFKMVRFLIELDKSQEIILPELQNASLVLMNNTKQLYFPNKLVRGNSHDRLYNDLIDLFKEKGGGWSAGLQNTRSKIFLERLSNAIWYVDPHIKLLRDRACHLPSLFQQLKTYKEEYSASEIWASSKCWNEIIPKIFSFVTMMRKYAEHLQKSAQLTINSHNSTEVVRSPNKHSTLKIISGSLNINSKYKNLEENLAKKDVYDFIEISEFLPSEYSNHYSLFHDIYRSETNKNHRPSLVLTHEGQEQCTVCGKWRCLYSQNPLNDNGNCNGKKYLYTCGGPILDDKHLLYNIIFVRELISCDSPIELNYYAYKQGDNVRLCYWCGAIEGLSDIPNSLIAQFKIVYPCCELCKELEKNHFTRLEIK
ncbi:6423_t:CDS:2, partial [Racocetra persica]